MKDDESFERFMAAALPGLLRFGHILTGDPHRAEELVQSALVKTYQRWGRVDQVTTCVRPSCDGQHPYLMVAQWTTRKPAAQ